MERPDGGALRVDGREIRDALDRVVLLRGVNCGGRSKWSPFMPFDFDDEASFRSGLDRAMNMVAATGANVIRMPFSWEGLEPERGAFDKQYLDRYAAMVDAAWARGIRTLVDFHQDVFATVFSGDGFPLWALGDIAHGEPRHDMPDGAWFPQYHDPNGPVAKAFDRFYRNDDKLLDAFEAMWQRMAKRFAKHPGVFGFEIMNEPGWGSMDIASFERKTLPALWQRIAIAIREVAPDAVIVGGGPGVDGLVGGTHILRPEIKGFVFAPHFYEVAVATGGRYRGAATIEAPVSTLANVGAEWNCPVLFGEFGASERSNDRVPYIRDLYALFDRLGVHATIWEVSFSKDTWNDEALGVIAPDGTPRALYAEADRAYPRAVSGKLESFSWSPSDGRFELRVDDAGAHATECYVPVRWIGDAPTITIVEGAATTHWDPKTGTLLAKASGRFALRVEK